MPKAYNEQLQDIFARYQDEVSSAPVEPLVVAQWAEDMGLWEPRKEDGYRKFGRDLSRALQKEYRIDDKGRKFRSKVAVRTSKDGRQTSLWADVDTAPHDHVLKSVGQRRNHIVGDCLQLRMQVDHYNEENVSGKSIQLILNFEEDVAERLVEFELELA